MKHTVQLTALSLVIAMGGAAEVAARGDHSQGGISFETLDTDGNGEISKAELQARQMARFTQMDADGDGTLSESELETHFAGRAARRAGKMMKHLDSDEDGRISADEMQPGHRMERMFSRLDKDGNGSLSEEEFDTAKTRMGKRRKGWFGGHGGRGHDGE